MAVGCLHPALRLRFAIFLLASIVATRTQAEAKPRSIAQVADLFTSVTNATKETLHRILHGDIGLWDMVCLIALCTALHLFTSGGRKKAAPHDDLKISSLSSAGLIRGSDESPNRQKSSLRASRAVTMNDAESVDPGLLKKYSSFRSYDTSQGTYPSIRTFYRPHPQAAKLPSKPTPLPLLVFIHGLGGSLAQFNAVLTSLVNVGPCLGIDLPGCGRSKFAPKTWSMYTTQALTELLDVAIKDHLQEQQAAVLVAHSMGCSLSALLATDQVYKSNILAMVGICPQGTPPSKDQISTYKMLLRIPTPIFNLWRAWDRRGGPDSASVARFVGKEADIEVKKLQERFNEQSQTAVWRRVASGALPTVSTTGAATGGIPGLETWARLKISIVLVGGESDNVTKVDQIEQIGRALGKIKKLQDSAMVDPTFEKRNVAQHNEIANGQINLIDSVSTEGRSSATETTLFSDKNEATLTDDHAMIPTIPRKRQVLKTSVLPAPAGHALLYDPATSRTLAGLIQTFLCEHVDSRLSLGWQLQHLSTEGKWDVKNLAKWQAVRPVSDPIAGIFRAMKTLREIDDTHSPAAFVQQWKGKIYAVIDISHENPVYDPKGLDEWGIEYHKFPTISKIPPTAEEVKDFIKLVDRLRGHASKKPAENPSSSEISESKPPLALIGVHCHYGFNRTGFFICCYLIEKEHYGVQQAIDTFRVARLPGIRHEHFLDQLFVRYCVGLKRAPTL